MNLYNSPVSVVPIKFNKPVVSHQMWTRSNGRGKLTSYARHRPWIVRLKHLLQNECYKRELYNTSHRSRYERAADPETESFGADGIEEDEGEGEADVLPSQVFMGCSWPAVHRVRR